MIVQEKKADWTRKNRFLSAPVTVDKDAPTYNSQKQEEKSAYDKDTKITQANGT